MAEKQGQKKKAPKRASWLTTDDEEREVRRQRALKEPMLVRRTGPGRSVFADYRVTRDEESAPGHEYIVELRSLAGEGNYCTCPDYAKNFLGTCKHIEKVVDRISRRRGTPRLSPFVEVHATPERDAECRVLLAGARCATAMEFMRPYLNADGNLKAPLANTLPVFLRDLQAASAEVRDGVRVSRSVHLLAERFREREANEQARRRFAERFDKDGYLRHPLYDYQCEGLMHLAFNGRAMLTDEMGLGKTVQAIGACKALKDLRGIGRVLVVCPASLKTEWEEQIRTFTSLSYLVVYGSRQHRLRIYREAREFFVIMNYEQIMRDEAEINEQLRPDVVILDEAQRIKNWKTKTAQSVKRLQSRYAFLLTGTPLENRIDEVYSVTEFIDPSLLGSLFRFNREFYQFDDEGQVVGMRNLRGLHEKLRPIMLRRRKSDISEQLPDRIDNNYFVPMTREQRNRYDEYEAQVATLSRIATQRPLTPQEFERLQLLLSCMRMLCDTVYILDQKITDSPKVEELEHVLNDIWSEDPNRKVIIFSEWVRMLDLVRVRLDEMGVAFGWHVGSVPQQKRREEINRFKDDPACRVFLSSDSGSVGLNLQAASVVVNLDLPWNPAKLEQRIARAWRKHQKNAVSVINLIAEGTIEHRMLGTLRFKQSLADRVLDGVGDADELEQPSAKSKFMERLGEVLNTDFAGSVADESAAVAPAPEVAPPPEPPATRFRQEATVSLVEGLDLCKVAIRDEDETVERVLAVSRTPDAARKGIEGLLEKTGHASGSVEVTVLDMQQYALLRQLAESGLIAIHDERMLELIERETVTAPEPDESARRAEACEPFLKKARRQAAMADVLRRGGFASEAVAPACQALDLAAGAIAILVAAELPERPAADLAALDFHAVKGSGLFGDAQFAFLLGSGVRPTDDEEAEEFVGQCGNVLDRIEEYRLALLM